MLKQYNFKGNEKIPAVHLHKYSSINFWSLADAPDNICFCFFCFFLNKYLFLLQEETSVFICGFNIFVYVQDKQGQERW